jgi:hypothetical protein
MVRALAIECGVASDEDDDEDDDHRDDDDNDERYDDEQYDDGRRGIDVARGGTARTRPRVDDIGGIGATVTFVGDDDETRDDDARPIVVMVRARFVVFVHGGRTMVWIVGGSGDGNGDGARGRGGGWGRRAARCVGAGKKGGTIPYLSIVHPYFIVRQ